MSKPTLHAPERALLHPAWWLALVVLAVNDHLLKGADVVPALLTGKLSDFAGLFMAPALLAALLRARHTAARLACHVAVGAVFAALQLSTTAVALWNDALDATLGITWRVWPDPWDLLALLALPLAWRVLGPIQREPLALEPRLRLLVQLFAILLGTAFSLATSPPEARPTCCTTDPIDADVLLHNSTGEDLVVRVRELSPMVALDCGEVASEPARYLAADELFEPAQTWNLPAWTTLPARLSEPAVARDCHAARIQIDGLPDAIVFWPASIPRRRIGGYFDRELGQEPPAEGTVLIEPAAGGALRLDDRGQGIVFAALPSRERFSGERCDALRVDDAERLAWSEPLPPSPARVVAAVPGPDGCFAIDLRELTAAPESAPWRWYACLPEAAWPFADGDLVRITALPDGAGVRVVEVATDTAAGDDELVLVRDAAYAATAGGAAALVELLPDVACALEREVGCGTLARGGRMQVTAVAPGGSTVESLALAPGARHRFRLDAQGGFLEVFAIASAERPVVNPRCSQGPATVGADLELVLHHHQGTVP